MLDGLARTFAGRPVPAKVRVTAFADGAGRDYPAEAVGVDHGLPGELAYSGMLGLAFDDRLSARRLFESKAFAATADEQRESFGAVHVFPVRETYAYRYGGRATLMGERGGPAARLIRELGAVNQAGDEVRSLLFGDAENRA